MDDPRGIPRQIDVDKNWWKALFDDVYLITDARSVGDEDLTRREVDFLTARVGMVPGDPILDLCGGQGRHALELARRGYTRLTLLDYSPVLLQSGRDSAHRQKLPIAFVRGDARRTGLRSASFRHVLVLGSSFGYFAEARENQKILAEAHRLAAPGGSVAIDLPNRRYVEKNFTPTTRHTVDGKITVTRTRVLKEGIVYAREQVTSSTRGRIRENTYCTRLYSPDAIRALLEAARFERVRLHADYMDRSERGDFGTMTKRMLVRARKPE